jgi:hypothetical protein
LCHSSNGFVYRVSTGPGTLMGDQLFDRFFLCLQLAGILVGFPLVVFVFGWAVLGRLTDLDAEERFAASWGVGFAFLALFQFGAFIVQVPDPHVRLPPREHWTGDLVWEGAHHEPPAPSHLGGVGLMVGIAAVFLILPSRRSEPRPFPWALAAGCLLFFLHLAFVQGLLDNYRGSYWYYDWWMHFDEARVLAGVGPVDIVWTDQNYTLASRTPLFNLVTASVMEFFGRHFWVHQMASVLCSSCFVAPVYLLVRDRFGRRAAWLALLLAPLNLWMLHLAWFTWSKMLAAYFVLLGLHFYLRSVRVRPADPGRGARLFLAFWVCGLLGFMTHQSAAVFVVPLLLHALALAIVRNKYLPAFREVVTALAVAALIVEPWYVWLIARLGPNAVLHTTPVTQSHPATRFRFLEIFSWVAHNLFTSVVPLPALRALLGHDLNPAEVHRNPLVLFAAAWELVRNVATGAVNGADLYDGLTVLYFSQFTGALTLSLAAYLAGLLVWRVAAPRPPPPGERPRTLGVEWSAVWLFVGLGIIGAACLHPSKVPNGIAHAALSPAVILLVALAWGVLGRADRGVAAAVIAGMVAEFLGMFWSHLWMLKFAPAVLEPLPGNADYKDPGEFLLNEFIGSGQYLFLAGVVVVQVVLLVLLVRWLLRKEPEGTSSGEPPGWRDGRGGDAPTAPPAQGPPGA